MIFPHLLIPVVTNPRKASRALQKVVDEMENRYELFSKVGARNIAGFNAKVAEYNAQSEMKQVPLPLIVVIVDELADLMMVASKKWKMPLFVWDRRRVQQGST